MVFSEGSRKEGGDNGGSPFFRVVQSSQTKVCKFYFTSDKEKKKKSVST